MLEGKYSSELLKRNSSYNLLTPISHILYPCHHSDPRVSEIPDEGGTRRRPVFLQAGTPCCRFVREEYSRLPCNMQRSISRPTPLSLFGFRASKTVTSPRSSTTDMRALARKPPPPYSVFTLPSLTPLWPPPFADVMVY